MFEKCRVFEFDVVSSTMDKARELLPEHGGSSFAVIANEQTSGRGRYNREWSSPVGNLYTTIVLPVDDTKNIHLFSYIVAVAVRESIASTVVRRAEVTLKWPNDLLINSKKIGGVLLEVEEHKGQSYLIIGIGLNLKSHPDETSYPATNVSHETGCILEPQTVLKSVLTSLDEWVAAFKSKGFGVIRAKWLEHRDPKHTAMQVTTYIDGAENITKGSFLDVDEDGMLHLFAEADQKVKKISVGDVYF